MKVFVYILVSLGFFLSSSTTEAGVCNSIYKALAARDLVPMRIDSEKAQLEKVPGFEREIPGDVGLEIIEAFKQLVDRGDWRFVGNEGDSLPDPMNLQGEVITALVKEETPSEESAYRLRAVAGKVMRVSIRYDEHQERRFLLRLLKSDGSRESLYLVDLYALFDLKTSKRPFWQRSAKKIKTVVEGFIENFIGWKEEVFRYGPARIFFPDRDAGFDAIQRYAGFGQVVQNSEHRWYFWLNPFAIGSRLYDATIYHSPTVQNDEFVLFTPKNGIGEAWNRIGGLAKNKIGQARVEYLGPFKDPVVQRYFDRPGKFSPLFINSPIFFLSFLAAYNSIEKYWWLEKLSDHTVEVLHEKQNTMIARLHEDPILSRVLSKFESGEITPSTAAEEVFLRYRAMDEWPAVWEVYRTANTKERVDGILGDKHISILLPATEFLVSEGPTPVEGIDVPGHELEPADLTEADELLKINNRHLVQRALLAELARVITSDEEMANTARQNIEKLLSVGPEFREEFRGLLNDSHLQRLIQLYIDGKISAADLEYFFLESAEISEKFARWSVFESSRYILLPSGERTLLSERELRAMRLRDLDRSSEGMHNILEVDFYPHSHDKHFDHADLLLDRNRTAAYLYAARGARPFFHQVARTLVKGRYKSVARAKAAEGQFILSNSNEVKLVGLRQSLVRFGINGVGWALIGWDVWEHWDQWRSVESIIDNVGRDPYRLNSLEIDRAPEAIQMMEQAEGFSLPARMP